MQKLLFTYILLCNDDSYYVGVTNDVIKRTLQHNSDNDPGSYCHSRRPVQLVFMRTFKNPDEAIAFEKQLKGWSKKKKQPSSLVTLNFCTNWQNVKTNLTSKTEIK